MGRHGGDRAAGANPTGSGGSCNKRRNSSVPHAKHQQPRGNQASAAAPTAKKLKAKKSTEGKRRGEPVLSSASAGASWSAKLSAAARIRATATTEEQLRDAEAQLTDLVTTIPDSEVDTWTKAGAKLATLLLQGGRNLGLASSLLTDQGFRYRLSVPALTQDHSRCVRACVW